jgi:predicted phosphoadenosine phosphosulfate sulfurtransferase
MSGGKDSTVVFHLACVVAAERGRLPIRVVWLDQEVEWQGTYDYMKPLMYRPDVQPYWFQFPMRLTNSLSHTHGFFTCWDPAARHLWIREQDPLSVRVNPCAPHDRYAYVSKHMHQHCGIAGKRHVGVLVGVRIIESPMRRMMVSKGQWFHQNLIGNTRHFWPIYDFNDQDVWTCIARNDLPYNRVYDFYFRYGVPRHDMRVSFLIHETSIRWIAILQEVEPQTYDRFVRRVPGVSTYAQIHEDLVPQELPAAFRSWREYRDYLLVNLVEPHNRPIFLKLWEGQNSEKWCRDHVRGIVINDIDATKLNAKKLIDRQKGF